MADFFPTDVERPHRGGVRAGLSSSLITAVSLGASGCGTVGAVAGLWGAVLVIAAILSVGVTVFLVFWLRGGIREAVIGRDPDAERSDDATPSTDPPDTANDG